MEKIMKSEKFASEVIYLAMVFASSLLPASNGLAADGNTLPYKQAVAAKDTVTKGDADQNLPLVVIARAWSWTGGSGQGPVTYHATANGTNNCTKTAEELMKLHYESTFGGHDRHMTAACIPQSGGSAVLRLRCEAKNSVYSCIPVSSYK